MHSSRMRTVRLLPVSPSMHCRGRVYLPTGGVPGPGGVYLPGGCTWSWGGVPARGLYLVLGGCTCPGRVPAWGCTWSRGVYPPRGCTCRRVPAQGVHLPRGGVPAQVLHSHLWTEFLTHACENITLPQTSFAGGNNIDLRAPFATQT